MADFLTPEERSVQMSKIRGKNTKAEVLVFRFLRRNGVYFQKHYKRVPGSPDIALPRKKRAVFIDGDFWHGRTLDKLMVREDVNPYWVNKINRNVERDAEQEEALLDSGWEILRVWTSDLMRKRTRDEELTRIKDFLTKSASSEH